MTYAIKITILSPSNDVTTLFQFNTFNTRNILDTRSNALLPPDSAWYKQVIAILCCLQPRCLETHGTRTCHASGRTITAYRKQWAPCFGKRPPVAVVASNTSSSSSAAASSPLLALLVDSPV